MTMLPNLGGNLWFLSYFKKTRYHRLEGIKCFHDPVLKLFAQRYRSFFSILTIELLIVILCYLWWTFVMLFSLYWLIYFAVEFQVPLEGFGALQGISGSQCFQIHKAYGSANHLPSAHTWYTFCPRFSLTFFSSVSDQFVGYCSWTWRSSLLKQNRFCS